ncbi:MAG: D-alanine--D-alanine ligase [Steroidobacter sp.]
MKSQRILVLMHETLVPPDDLQGYSARQIQEFRTEYDVMRQLEVLGHQVRSLGLGDDLEPLREAIREWRPHIAFNLLEEFNGIVSYDQHVVAYLELMQQRYTGCNPRGLMMSRDKALAKKILAYHQILTPRFAVLPKGRRVAVPPSLRYPLFVKSVIDDASLGISRASIVSSERKLKQRVEFIHEHTGSDALVEEYIAGRELYVPVLGNDRLTVYPVWELSITGKKEPTPLIATRRTKWNADYRNKHGIDTHVAQDLSPALQKHINTVSADIYRTLSLTGYARLDFRLTTDNQLYFLEANANPNLSADEDLAASAAHRGDDYAALLGKILKLGLAYKAAWKA